MTTPADEFTSFLKEIQSAWVTQEPEEVAKLAAFESTAVGYGYRDRSARDLRELGEEGYASVIARFGSLCDYYETEWHELNASVEGDIAVAWGSFSERFKLRDGEPEEARSRVTMVARRDGDSWQLVQFHRDIQPFEPGGRYASELTRPA